MANKQQNFIEKIKSNLCVFGCKNSNYESIITYNDKKDNFEKLLTPKLQTKSRTRLAIYYKTPTNKQNDTFELESIMKQNNNEETLSNPIHSTKINENIKTPNISKLPYLLMSPQDNYENKISSTMVYKILSKTKVSKFNKSPNASEIQMFDINESTTSNDYKGGFTSETSESSSNFDDISIYYEIGTIYSCHVPYKATHDGDLTIKFAERLQIIKDDGQDFILVKNLSNHKFGYIPRDHIVPVNKFLANLA
jgi:hypothetical protein